MTYKLVNHVDRISCRFIYQGSYNDCLEKFSCKKHSGLNGAYWISVFKTKRSAPRKFLKQHSSSHKCRQNHKY